MADLERFALGLVMADLERFTLGEGGGAGAGPGLLQHSPGGGDADPAPLPGEPIEAPTGVRLDELELVGHGCIMPMGCDTHPEQ